MFFPSLSAVTNAANKSVTEYVQQQKPEVMKQVEPDPEFA